MMLQHEQFLSGIHHHHNLHQHQLSDLQQQQQQHEQQQQQQQQQQEGRPLQQSSPSDQSVSTGTPPHQVSRASPASTALVMSSNNIAGGGSRQLTPNSGSSGGGGGGTGSSLGEHSPANACTSEAAAAQHEHDGPPNPTLRQFATCHSKSMSAGVVVPVPGISSNLATATGMQANNLINNTIAAQQQQQHNSHYHNHHHQQQHQSIQEHIQQQQHMQHQHQHNTLHHPSNSALSQQQQQQQQQPMNGFATSKRPHQKRSSHQRSVSSQQHAISQQQQHQLEQHQQQALNYQQHTLTAGSSSQNFLDGGGGGSSSIILSNANINNIHNRSQSAHLSSLILGHQHQHQFAPPQASQRTHINVLGSHEHEHHQHHNQNDHKTNSIWSIDENLSKSYSKLTASGYHLHPASNGNHHHNHHHQHQSYLLNPSVTDISCDNISTASRLMGLGLGLGLGLGGGSTGLGPVGASGGDLSGPAPGYYSHHATAAASQAQLTGGSAHGGPPGHHNSQALSLAASGISASLRRARFLPICDLLFNLLSMVLYFCENVFGIIALIALYYHGALAASRYWALVGAAFVLASNFICQYLSLRWLYCMKLDECRRKREAQVELENEEECERRYNNNNNHNNHNNHNRGNQSHLRNPSTTTTTGCGSSASACWLPDGATELQLKYLMSIVLDTILHLLCLGFLARYIKLVVPVSDTSRVKREARDLCMLRMIHGFVQSAPLLLLQAYMVCSQSYAPSIANLGVISVILSLLNVCWALASFTKYARKKYMHKFVLTWLGILSQLLWRLGTISSRVAALTIYAVYYNYWMLVVLALHWVTMFLWLVKPGNLLRDETGMSRTRKLSLAVGASWIYCFCYMNFEEHNSRTKMGIFYLIMFVENNLLFTVCQAFSAQVTWFKSLVILVIYLGFVFGMLFMLLYYKYFHVSVLNSELAGSQDSIDSIADQLSPAGKKIAGFKPGTLRLKSEDCLRGKFGPLSAGALKTGSHPEIARANHCAPKPPYLAGAPSHATHLAGAQSSGGGIFNCKLTAGNGFNNNNNNNHQSRAHKKQTNMPNLHVRQ